jgi:hypothetical protein
VQGVPRIELRPDRREVDSCNLALPAAVAAARYFLALVEQSELNQIVSYMLYIFTSHAI